MTKRLTPLQQDVFRDLNIEIDALLGRNWRANPLPISSLPKLDQFFVCHGWKRFRDTNNQDRFPLYSSTIRPLTMWQGYTACIPNEDMEGHVRYTFNTECTDAERDSFLASVEAAA